MTRQQLKTCLQIVVMATPVAAPAQGYYASHRPGFHNPYSTQTQGRITVPNDRTIRSANMGIIGRYDSEGRVYDGVGTMTGKVTDDLIQSGRGEIQGHIHPDGSIYDARGGLVARRQGDTISSANGDILGHADASGRVSDARGNIIGTVPSDAPLAAYRLLHNHDDDQR